MPDTSVKVWYRVGDLGAACVFYVDLLAFEEIYRDGEGSWARLRNGSMEIGLSEGEPEEGGVAVVDVGDVKAEAERLRAAGVEVGTVLELQGKIRLLDVFDPDGNRIQLAQLLAPN
jgi:catechol 2,3-dioxygenase-like lactoylglutathione lyase family enzyme